MQECPLLAGAARAGGADRGRGAVGEGRAGAAQEVNAGRDDRGGGARQRGGGHQGLPAHRERAHREPDGRTRVVPSAERTLLARILPVP